MPSRRNSKCQEKWSISFCSQGNVCNGTWTVLQWCVCSVCWQNITQWYSGRWQYWLGQGQVLLGHLPIQMILGQSSLEEHCQISYHQELVSCFMQRAKKCFKSILDELMKTFWGKESILDNLRDISENWGNFARFILNNTEGTCGKVATS